MGENIYQLHFRRGADIQGLQRIAGIKHQGNKTINTRAKNLKRYFSKKKKINKKASHSQVWWRTLVIPALGGRSKQISVSSRPAWSTEWVLGQPGLHRNPASEKLNNNNKKPELFLKVSNSPSH